ncbi:MAG: L-aspartate oxidase [Candidatus Syntrophonatronum acetioxidans]|uniref:L-aspartate oxidase n=1 Tax=Candidatus Syntrophonatronum acetioxidans TaxID=1795816 RepID=A0A424YCK6_9FIRM|nr:MAG: L-aspartate oxidase [Candidatus Syntrophonatronum acetioxidans]
MIPRYLLNFDLSQLETEYCDYLIIGGGVAGLFSALKAAPRGKVIVLAKATLEECNTSYAQGGIASVVKEDDSPSVHYEDTMEAGVGICNPEAVKVLVEEGVHRVRELIEIGVSFDRENTNYALGREGAHSRDRILHVGDSTGKAIQDALMGSTRKGENITIEENVFVMDLLTWEGKCVGSLVYNKDDGKVRAYLARAVIMATGGMGQLFERSTNSVIATGDGLAMAYRAGAEVMDLEFFQFHPTVFYSPEGKAFLISEAVRGAGGILRNEEEEQFMIQYHPLADLGPRDIVTRAMMSVLKKTRTEKIYLDLRHLGKNFIKKRFPNIYSTLKAYQMDVARDLIPVVPAAHYTMGGVKTGLSGETSVPGLFAAGEVACTGIHGANRLASNSLLEGLVFGERAVEGASQYIKEFSPSLEGIKISYFQQRDFPLDSLDISRLEKSLKRLMFEKVGIIRYQECLQDALDFIKQNSAFLTFSFNDIKGFELQNMMLAARLTAWAALLREESRGGHYRQDFPSGKKKWRGHLVFALSQEREEEVNWLGTSW